MEKARGKRTWWYVAAGVCALVAIVAIVVGLGASPSNVDPSADVAAGSEAGETSSPPDAATIGTSTDTDTAMEEQQIGEFVPNEVLVSVEDPALLETLVPGAEIANGTIVAVETVTEGSDGAPEVVKVTFEGDATEDDVVSALEEMGASAQKNFVYHLM